MKERDTDPQPEDRDSSDFSNDWSKLMETAPQPLEIQNVLKDVMAAVATPVSVVTTTAEGQPFGTTVSAFNSLSMEPPMVLVSLARTSETLQMLTRTKTFGVNILGSDQASTATNFARKGGPEKFGDTPWNLAHGVPRLERAPGWICCVVANLVDGGDHVIVLGHVIAAESIGGGPLVYHCRRFGTHVPHPEVT